MSEFLQVKPSKRTSLKQVLSIATSPSEDEQITHVFALQKEREEACQNNENISSFKISIKSPKTRLNQNKIVSNPKHHKNIYHDQKLQKQNFTGYLGFEQSLKKIRSQPSLNFNCLCQTQTRNNIENGNNDFYKYWKQKANQYQTNNFSLLSKNSTLQLQIERLKLENKNLLKQLSLQQGKMQQWALENEEKMKKIQELQTINKKMDHEVLLLTDKLSKESSKLEKNQEKLQKFLQDKSCDMKVTEKQREDNGQIKTRWSLKEAKNKNMSVFWQDQFQIPQLQQSKHHPNNHSKFDDHNNERNLKILEI